MAFILTGEPSTELYGHNKSTKYSGLLIKVWGRQHEVEGIKLGSEGQSVPVTRWQDLEDVKYLVGKRILGHIGPRSIFCL
jgi:hypothetical protein